MCKYREVWVTLNPDSVDKDNLTHIALHEKFDDRESMHFIEYTAYLVAQEHRNRYQSALYRERKEYKKKLENLSARLEK